MSATINVFAKSTSKAFCFNLPGYWEGQGIVNVRGKDCTYDAQANFSDINNVVKLTAKIKLRAWDSSCPSMSEHDFRVECENSTVSMYSDKTEFTQGSIDQGSRNLSYAHGKVYFSDANQGSILRMRFWKRS